MATVSSRKTSNKRSPKKPAAAKKTLEKNAARIAVQKAPPKSASAFGLSLKPWIETLRRPKGADARSGRRAFVFVFANVAAGHLKGVPKGLPKNAKGILADHLNKWQTLSLLESEAESVFFQGANGPLWIVRLLPTVTAGAVHSSGLDKSAPARLRDLVGAVVPQLANYQSEKLILEFHGLTLEEEAAALTGLEIASYSFKETASHSEKPRRKRPELLIKEGLSGPSDIAAAGILGLGVNLARHYVNLPADALNPRTYAENIKDIFANSATVSIEVWEGDKLKEERMGLLHAVGAAASESSRFVHLCYRPKQSIANTKPVALVGKGVTFDSGGLDLKPASGMRLMKKDMGGSAAVVAIMKWAEQSALPLPLDAYVSLAENAVGSRAFRPGDIITARNGATVEISNTDAEGRLVLADALDVAVTQTDENKPACVINVATLTGAIKVGLGAEIAGLFSNSDSLAAHLTEAGLECGDLMWRMPLFQPYRAQLKSPFADMMNSAEGGFGGAITAALFLESFVRATPWAHLDVYAWRDGAGGAWAEAGGNGQPVQALARVLRRLADAASVANAEELA